MDELMDIIVETELVHDAFRLWMTTEVHKHFPITLLQMSIKFANEPPQGLRAGLKRTYSGESRSISKFIGVRVFKLFSSRNYEKGSSCCGLADKNPILCL